MLYNIPHIERKTEDSYSLEPTSSYLLKKQYDKTILLEVITDKLGRDHFYEVIRQPGSDAEVMVEL